MSGLNFLIVLTVQGIEGFLSLDLAPSVILCFVG